MRTDETVPQGLAVIEGAFSIRGLAIIRAVLVEADAKADQQTEELFALLSNEDRPTPKEDRILWNDRLSHRQKVTRLTALKAERDRRAALGLAELIPFVPE